MAKKEKSQKNDSAHAQKPARVFIVDDHPFVRSGICTLLNAQRDMICCGEAGSAKEALAQIDAAKPDVMIVDISLPGVGGLDLIRDINASHRKIPALVLSMHDEAVYAEQALRAGAVGYIMKSDPPEQLLEGLRTVLNGGRFFSQRLATAMLNAFVSGSPRSAERPGVEALSPRELQVFEGIGEGLSVRRLAEKYGISPKTVESHSARIKQKMGLADGNALIHAAVRWMENEASGDR